MPCSCWEPAPPRKIKLVRDLLTIVADEMRDASRKDYEGLNLHDVTKMLEHLYTGKCDERPK